MKRIVIELDDNGNSKTEFKLDGMQPIHYSVFISELFNAILMMTNQRNKMVTIKKNE